MVCHPPTSSPAQSDTMTTSLQNLRQKLDTVILKN